MNNTFYNVVILDKSGSMSSIRKQAIDGVNETFGSIRSSQKKHPDMKQLVTLVAFCGCEQKVIYENTPIDEVKDITQNDYQPCCMTPLYDTIGNVCSRLHNQVKGDATASVAVTIITDGYENASREFSGKAIKALIEAYKEDGWMFAYIGADHDVEAVAFSLAIDNHMSFNKTEAGTAQMFAKMSSSLNNYISAVEEASISCDDDADFVERKKDVSKNFFSL
ncbi:MAG: VWA domain-containing protein [Muribaculaceae bacterium]|nr:VWA domain-containing protein [Muribaculaceae bacterium]